jgi:hypothetical protein
LADAEGIASAGLNPSLVLELRARLAEVAHLFEPASAIGAIIAKAAAWAEGQPVAALRPLDAKFAAALDGGWFGRRRCTFKRVIGAQRDFRASVVYATAGGHLRAGRLPGGRL